MQVKLPVGEAPADGGAAAAAPQAIDPTAFADAHRQLLGDSTIQFDLPRPEPPPELPNWIGALGPVVQLLREIGARYGKSPAQVALRWLIENERVLPIPGAKNGKQAADNAGALTFSLTPAEIAALDRATLAWQG